MKKLLTIVVCIVGLLAFIRFARNRIVENEAVGKHNSLVTEATECMDAGQWKCAEMSIGALLQETPDDKNLQLHMAGILFEQERYEDCIAYIEKLGYTSNELDFLRKKSRMLLDEMKNLQLERSYHFRLEFEGNPSRNDILEALSVLEVAYDSLCRLFEFYPENKMHLVLYQSADYQGLGPRPDWVGAVFDGKLRVPVGLMQRREVYRPILFHELTHSFIRAMTRTKVPLWLNEGIAQVVDASRNGAERPAGGKPSLQSLTELFVKENNTDVALKLYWYSQKMVENLLRRNSSFPHFRDFIQSLRYLEVDESLKKFYGVTSQQLLDEV